MRFSVLVPVYNVQSYLQTCLESIIGQTYRNFEVILVDDGSTDQSGVICDRYSKQYDFIKVVHKKNEGLISARRIGLKYAVGEYCLFCDSDDFLEIDALERLQEVLSNNLFDLVIFNANAIDSGGGKTPFFENVLPEGEVKNKEILFNLMLTTYKINSICIKVFRRSIVDLKFDYTDYFRLNFGEDLLQSIPLVINSSRIFYLNRRLYNYRTFSGMMHHYSDNYYSSYKKINQLISNRQNDIQIVDFKLKLAIHLLIAAYGATTQLKYLDVWKVAILNDLSSDLEFRRAYELVRYSPYIKLLSVKQRYLLYLLYKKEFSIIHLTIMVRRLKI